MTSPLKIGDKAPDFKNVLPDGTHFTLSSLRGKQVVLYFYPKDNTPGCTKEACDFRDHFDSFNQKNTVIIGISRDSHKSHLRFKSLFSLPFILLADETGEISTTYGTWVQKSMFGKKYFGIERTTFLINEEGVIAHIWHKVKVLGHVNAILKKLR